jgi:hypothetical protein
MQRIPESVVKLLNDGSDNLALTGQQNPYKKI